MISESTKKLLLASKVSGVGRKTLLSLARDRLFFEMPPDKWHLDFPEFKNFAPDGALFARAMSAVEKDMEAAQRHGASVLSVADAKYPELLLLAEDKPALLYVRGDVNAFSKQAIGIIGTREPSDHGKITARRIGVHFASKGWQVVSGLAIGLDTVAHEAALEANGSTVAVLAHGLDTVYPRKNAALAERIIGAGGLLVSEYSFGTPGFPAHFVERDRIQAALSLAVVMVQSGESGGSWHASRAALRYGRRLVVPYPTARDAATDHPKIQGNRLLIESSAAKKAALLSCSQADLEKLFIIESRDDYPKLEQLLAGDGRFALAA